MSRTLTGKAWVFGDKIDTDLLAPGYAMKKGPQGLAEHCLEAIDPEFATTVQPGDIVFGGEDFGIGSSREQAAISLKLLGVSAVVAKSFARIFYRNAINIGLPALTLEGGHEIATGDEVTVDLVTGMLMHPARSRSHEFTPLPSHLREMIAAGGLMAQLERDFAAQEVR